MFASVRGGGRDDISFLSAFHYPFFSDMEECREERRKELAAKKALVDEERHGVRHSHLL